MCLGSISKKEESEILASLPDPFPCWKLIRRTGHSQYDWEGNEPKILARGTYTAKLGSTVHRTVLDYPPGFHAYIDKVYIKWHIDGRNHSRYIARKFWARKKDIVKIGTGMDGLRSEARCVAVSKITRK